MLNLSHVELLGFGKECSVLFNITDDHIEHVGLSLHGANLSGDLELLLDNLLRLRFVDSASGDIDLASAPLFDSISVDSTITEEGEGQILGLALVRISKVPVRSFEGSSSSLVQCVDSALDISLSSAITIFGADKEEFAGFFSLVRISVIVFGPGR